jgi:hypothetical protein
LSTVFQVVEAAKSQYSAPKTKKKKKRVVYSKLSVPYNSLAFLFAQNTTTNIKTSMAMLYCSNFKILHPSITRKKIKRKKDKTGPVSPVRDIYNVIRRSYHKK